MGAVARDEFDRLVERVNRIERTLAATVEIVASEVVGLRTYLDDRFALVDARFDFVDRRFDALGEEIQIDLDRQDRKLDAILGHLGIEPPPDG
jgi:hypothetical protein